MSNQSIISNKSNRTLTGKEKDRHSIPFRIEFIKQLLNKSELNTMVNLDNTDTENFAVIKKEDEDNSSDGKSYDTKSHLNKRMVDFVSAINQMGGQLEYIKSGTTGHTFKGKIPDSGGEEKNYAVKVVAYPKKERYGNIYDARRPENAELMMIKLLSYFVVKGQTPHIVLPITTFNTEIKTFVNLIEDNIVDKDDSHKYVDFVKKYHAGEYFDDVSILVSEWANRGDFLDFMRKTYQHFKPIHWKVFFFQLLSTLAVIQSKFPSFRHNDMKANNVLIEKVDKKRSKFSYTVERNKYLVPNIGYMIKLWDFDFACIPGVVENSKVSSEWTKTINVIPEQNRYYDMHYFFNTLTRKGFFPQFNTESCVPEDAKEFVKRVVPEKYREGKFVHKRGRILVTDEYLTPNEILKTDPYFAEFREGVTKASSERKKVTPKAPKPKSQNKKKKKSDDLDNVRLEDLLSA